CGPHHSDCKRLRHSTFHYARDFDLDHGRRRGQTVQRGEMDGGGTDHLGLDFDAPRHRPDRIYSSARGGGAVKPRSGGFQTADFKKQRGREATAPYRGTSSVNVPLISLIGLHLLDVSLRFLG